MVWVPRMDISSGIVASVTHLFAAVPAPLVVQVDFRYTISFRPPCSVTAVPAGVLSQLGGAADFRAKVPWLRIPSLVLSGRGVDESSGWVMERSGRQRSK